MNATKKATTLLSKPQQEALMELAYHGLRGDYDQKALRELASMGLLKVVPGKRGVELTDTGRRLDHELRTKRIHARQTESARRN